MRGPPPTWSILMIYPALISELNDVLFSKVVKTALGFAVPINKLCGQVDSQSVCLRQCNGVITICLKVKRTTIL